MLDDARVRAFIESHDLQCGAVARYVDLTSEVGELGKELLKGSDYGKSPLQVGAEAREEMGDCLFSLLALCAELDIDPSEALDVSLKKYEARFAKSGQIGSGA